MLNITKFTAGYLRTNNYLISSDTDKLAVLIDAGGGFEKIDAYLKANNLKLTALLLTHGHFDHITIAKKLKDEYNLKVYIHTEDAEMLTSEKNLAYMVGLNLEPCQPDVILNGGETLTFGEMNFEVIHTPGHSKGSVSYVLNNKYLFCGDTLFYESYGATHFYGGSIEQIKDSLAKLFALDGDMPAYCGHNRDTTLEHERRNNPINV